GGGGAAETTLPRCSVAAAIACARAPGAVVLFAGYVEFSAALRQRGSPRRIPRIRLGERPRSSPRSRDAPAVGPSVCPTSCAMDLVERLKQALGLSKEKPKRGAKKPEPAAKEKKSAAKKPAGPRAAKLLNLDASDLLPITADELRESLQDLIRSGGWRFTGRGAIPVGDERTRLINRALLTNGLLTPEQLDEINQIAIDYERLQKGLAAIEQAAIRAADKAVEADREARAELKKQQKAEAEERKRQHAEAVAQRRAADIYFLGRGVSARLHQKGSDIARVTARNPPLLPPPPPPP